MANANNRQNERRCRAMNRHGQRCRVTTGLGADGLCSMHGGRVDPRELGRKGGSVGKGGAQRREAIRNNPSLRAYLRENVSPQAVWAAITAALEGNSEAARVSASKLLIDSLHEPEREKEREAWVSTAAEQFKRKLEQQVANRTPADLAEHVLELLDRLAVMPHAEFHRAATKLTDEHVRAMQDRLAVVAELVASTEDAVA